MQQQEEITLICPVHGQTTLTALFEECENNQTGCLKCRSIKWEMKDQTFKQLTTLLYTKKIKVLSELEKNCEQRLKIIYELFLNIKNQMNEHLENILNIITDQTKTIAFNIKREYDNIQEKPIPELCDAEKQLKDYHLVKEKLKDKHFQNVQKMRDRVLREYFGFQENLNEKIKMECFGNKFKEQKINSNTIKQPNQSDSNFKFLCEKLPKYVMLKMNKQHQQIPYLGIPLL